MSTAGVARIARPDSKGRVGLGAFMPEGVSGFRVHTDSEHRIILEPLIEKSLHVKSKLKVSDLASFSQTLPTLSPQEKADFQADLKRIRCRQSPVSNPWVS